MKLLLLLLILPINVLAYQTSATSTCFMDVDSNRIIYKDNENTVRSVASISKIMTAILAIESGKLEDIVVIGDINSYGSGIYVKKGEKISLLDLVYGLMLRSGNDAAIAIAEHVSGTKEEFVKLMNQKASEIGMTKTVFVNPSGLDQEDGGNKSTACDMAKLMAYCMQNETFKEITKTKKHKVKTNMNYYEWTNKNKLLTKYKYAIGGKTGFTEKARRTLVTAAKKGPTTLTVVTLNDGNDFEDHENLYNEAFKEYKTYTILKKGYIDIPDEEFYKNRYFYVKERFKYLLKETEKNKILIKYNLKELYNYKDNDQVGKATIYLDDEKIFETDIFISIKKKKIKIWDLIFK